MHQNALESQCGARTLPQRYGFIDERLLSQGYLKRLSSEAVLLYVFLCIVADRRGRSWYSDGKLVSQVRLRGLGGARLQLIEAGLISYDAPVYTVLTVPDASGPARQVSHSAKRPVSAPPIGPGSASAAEPPATREEVQLLFSRFE